MMRVIIDNLLILLPFLALVILPLAMLDSANGN
jgi:hypothetical protein